MTKMRDNFSNPNPFLSQVKNYQDLVNQRTPSDSWAESLRQLGNQPAKGPQQRRANAIMHGFASGIQGAADQRRQDRLSPILEQAGQITARAAELEAQSQQERQRIFTGTKFVRDNITRLMALGEGSMARDAVGTQGVARELGREYQKAFGLNLGEFDNYDVNSRRIFYAKDGVVTGYSIPDILREYATEAFGEQAPYVMRTLDPYSKNTWEYSQAMEQAELAQKQSSAKMNNAHADLFKAETDKTRHEMENPPMSEMDKFDYQETRKSNETFLKNLTEEVQTKDPETKLKVLNRMKEIISNGGGEFGSTPQAAFIRYIKEKFGKDADIQEAKMLQKYFFPDIKGVAGNPNAKEWEDLVTRIISGDQNIDSALNMIEFEIQQATALKNKYANYSVALTETKNRLPYYHPDITSRVNKTALPPTGDEAVTEDSVSDDQLGIKW